MKLTFIAAVLTLSSSAFASLCEVDMVDNYNRVITTFRSYDSFDGCKESMKECRKEIRLTNRVGRANCVRANSVPTPPAPRPVPPSHRPNPRPVPPIPSYGVTANGYLENRLFEFYGRDAAELYINCLNEMPRVRSGNIDDLFYTVNGNDYKSVYNTASYYSDTQICSILEQEARSSYGTQTIRYTRVLGTLEKSTFEFEGNSRSELLNQCHLSITNLKLGDTDDMSYSVNGSSFNHLRNSASYWKSPEQVCRVLLRDLNSKL